MISSFNDGYYKGLLVSSVFPSNVTAEQILNTQAAGLTGTPS